MELLDVLLETRTEACADGLIDPDHVGEIDPGVRVGNRTESA